VVIEAGNITLVGRRAGRGRLESPPEVQFLCNRAQKFFGNVVNSMI
jgi:hypothetical protein